MAIMEAVKKQASPYPLRMADDVKTWLQQRAKANDRTVHAEIIRILKEAREEEQRHAA
ncbi:MAG: Arc family DNA-binding protein [Candidatus Thiothrix sulfatifontis]|nr:MAG: Arc family DNA-binding protein [Candidatus Thiothrix sulfatifontis]